MPLEPAPAHWTIVRWGTLTARARRRPRPAGGQPAGHLATSTTFPAGVGVRPMRKTAGLLSHRRATSGLIDQRPPMRGLRGRSRGDARHVLLATGKSKTLHIPTTAVLAENSGGPAPDGAERARNKGSNAPEFCPTTDPNSRETRGPTAIAVATGPNVRPVPSKGRAAIRPSRPPVKLRAGLATRPYDVCWLSPAPAGGESM
jgi:hypothetical protein